jgi:hypothetical protein
MNHNSGSSFVKRSLRVRILRHLFQMVPLKIPFFVKNPAVALRHMIQCALVPVGDHVSVRRAIFYCVSTYIVQASQIQIDKKNPRVYVVGALSKAYFLPD